MRRRTWWKKDMSKYGMERHPIFVFLLGFFHYSGRFHVKHAGVRKHGRFQLFWWVVVFRLVQKRWWGKICRVFWLSRQYHAKSSRHCRFTSLRILTLRWRRTTVIPVILVFPDIVSESVPCRLIVGSRLSICAWVKGGCHHQVGSNGDVHRVKELTSKPGSIIDQDAIGYFVGHHSCISECFVSSCGCCPFQSGSLWLFHRIYQ